MTLAPDWTELGLESEWDSTPDLPSDWDESGFNFAYSATDWQEWAVCAQTDPEAFFPETRHTPYAAKAVCERCPVREQCLDYALANGGALAGVWGGLTEAERSPLRRARPCGREGCDNPRGYGKDGARLEFCSDQCYALARIGRRAAEDWDSPRVCANCGEEKPRSAFYRQAGGVQRRCKPCAREANRERRAAKRSAA